jgi:membrane protease YdiL (CAAX protease family)
MIPSQPGGDGRDEPFWTYRDLLIFALLSLPCLVASALFARALSIAVPQIGVSKTWIAMLLFYVLWFGALYVLLYTGYRRPFWSSLGWRYPITGKAFAVVGGPALAMLVGLLGTLFRTPVIETSFRKLVQDRLSLVLFGVFSMIIGPVCEELAFRGFLMPLLVRSFGWVAGIVGAALPFALLHGDQYSWTWQYIVLVALAGVVFGWVRYRTGSTMASALMHSTYNATFYAAYVIGGVKI